MTDDSAKTRAGRRLLRLGMLLFLLGLATGLLVPALANTRLGLSSHPEGLMNGPVINAAGRTDVLTSQAQVDDLLESLGF